MMQPLIVFYGSECTFRGLGSENQRWDTIVQELRVAIRPCQETKSDQRLGPSWTDKRQENVRNTSQGRKIKNLTVATFHRVLV